MKFYQKWIIKKRGLANKADSATKKKTKKKKIMLKVKLKLNINRFREEMLTMEMFILLLFQRWPEEVSECRLVNTSKEDSCDEKDEGILGEVTLTKNFTVKEIPRLRHNIEYTSIRS